MAWQTDWLYQLVFTEVANLWNKLHTSKSGMGVPPDEFRIEEMSGAAWEVAQCRGRVRKAWTFNAESLQFQSADRKASRDRGTQSGMYWQVGLVQFHVGEDRKRIAFEFVVGPRYGRGMVYRVIGQGKRGRLEQEGARWVS